MLCRIASAYGVQEQRGGRLKETDGALGGGVGSGRRHPFDFGVRVYGVMQDRGQHDELMMCGGCGRREFERSLARSLV